MQNGTDSYKRFLAGDNTGLAELVAQYRDGLILYLNTYVGNIVDAEELAEDVFVELAVRRPRFREQSGFRTWLYGIARNLALRFLRKQGRAKPVEDADAVLTAVPDLQTDIEREYLVKEQRIAVHRALGALCEAYRQVLYLSYFEGFSNAEIAAVMRKNKRQVENLLCRARAALRTQLTKEGFHYENIHGNNGADS